MRICWPANLKTVLTLVRQPHASDQILHAFQKTFYAHLQTMFCGVCFLQAARAWPEEILRKAGPLSSLDLCSSAQIVTCGLTSDICHGK